MQTKSTRKVALLLTALLIGVIASESALAHGRRGGGRVSIGIGVGFGAPFAAYPFYRPYYYSPFYYPPYSYPPIVVVPAVPPAPPVYIEQLQVLPPMHQQAPVAPPAPQTFQPPGESAPQSSGNLWYFCPDSKTYYPYVKECPSAWQPVTPQPQS